MPYFQVPYQYFNKKQPSLASHQQMFLKSQLNDQIKAFDKSKLHHIQAYLCRSSVFLGPHFFKVHSFIAVGYFNPQTGKDAHAIVYSPGRSVTQAPFRVSKLIVGAASLSRKLSQPTKDAIDELKGRQFASVEHFLRELIARRAKLTGEKLSTSQIIHLATYPDAELRHVVALKNYQLGNRGAALLLKSGSQITQKDQQRLAHAQVRAEAIGNVDVEQLRDVFNTQMLFKRYLEEKAGIGKSMDEQFKNHIPAFKAAQTLANFAKFHLLPNPDNHFQANCNKIAYNFLREAAVRTLENKTGQLSCANNSSHLHKGLNYGYKQVLTLWNPLKMSLLNVLEHLVGQQSFPINAVPYTLDQLAHHKKDFIILMDALPSNLQKEALQEALGQGTALGQIFSTEVTHNLLSPERVSNARYELELKLEQLAQQNPIKLSR